MCIEKFLREERISAELSSGVRLTPVPSYNLSLFSLSRCDVCYSPGLPADYPGDAGALLLDPPQPRFYSEGGRHLALCLSPLMFHRHSEKMFFK